jgi:hypothetical protein
MVPGPTADHGAHRGIDAQALGVVEILVAGQAAEEGLSQESHKAVACVPTGPWVVQHVGSRIGELQGVVEFTVAQESGVAGYGGAVEFEAKAAVELRSERVGLVVTHQKSLSGRQKTSENPGKAGRFAQVLCHTQGFIWEFRDQGRAKVLKVEAGANGGLAGDLAVSAVPTVVAFRDGKEVGRLVGFKPESAYRKLLVQAGVEG